MAQQGDKRCATELDPRAQLVEMPGAPAAAPARRRLLMVFRDGAQACLDNVEPWMELASGLGPGDEVWVIGFSAETALMGPVVDRLRSGHVPYRLFRVKDPVAFQLQTGLRTVPVTVLVDGEFRVLRVAAGVLAPEALDALNTSPESRTSAASGRVYAVTGRMEAAVPPTAKAAEVQPCTIPFGSGTQQGGGHVHRATCTVDAAGSSTRR
jgi:hypothetical protein